MTRACSRARPRRRRARPGRYRREDGWSLRLDQGSRGRALPVTNIGDIGAGLVVVDVELGADVRGGELVELLQRRADAAGAARTCEPRLERLAGRAFLVELPNDAHHCFGRAL